MTDQSAFGAESWSEAGRQYWEAWYGLWQQGVQSAGRGGTPPDEPWGRAFEDWWLKATPGVPGAPPELLQGLMEQGKAFLRLGEQLAASAGAPDLTGIGTAWKLPFDTWSRTVSSASVFPGDVLEHLKADGWTRAADDLHRNMERFLSVPGLGYTREWQEQGQELARLGLSYQRALQEYGSLFQRFNLDALNRLRAALADRAEAEKPVTTLRGLYDICVDASEAAYADLVATETYAEAYGRMVNALMALKRHGRNMVDEAVGTLGMPTRHGFRTLQRRHQELRRQVATLRAQIAGTETERGEIAEMRKQIDRLRADFKSRDPAAPPPTPAAPSARRPRRRAPGRGSKTKGG
jgi:polyhydroxyalkanoate synthase subunit PhaE